jgi:hypothetical protein
LALKLAGDGECRSLQLKAAISLYRFRRNIDGGAAERGVLNEIVAWFRPRGAEPWLAKAVKLLGD